MGREEAAGNKSNRSIYTALVTQLETLPKHKSRFKLEALNEAFRLGKSDMLRLYDKFLLEHRPYSIRSAVEANIALNHQDPYAAVTPECMAVVSRLHQALLEERTNNRQPAVDSQSLTILRRWVVANPEDLETVISLVMVRGLRSHRSNLAALNEMKRQQVKLPFRDGIL